MKIAIVLNSKRTSTELADRLNQDDLAVKHDVTYDLFIKEPHEIEATLKSLNYQTYNACIIGGGDGTVRTAAQVLADQELPLAILPLGTFNMLAKSLEHPNDIDALIGMVKNNKTKQIDLAEVNDIIFINHAWIGFYYQILKLRERHKNILKRSKLLKLLFNAFNLFRPLVIYELEINMEGKKSKHRTALIYIGNNDHDTNLLDFGDRKSLSSGLLSVAILNCKDRWDFFLCMLSILVNKFKYSKYVTQFTTESLAISSKNTSINIVLDGEMLKLQTPLNFSINKKKLMVIIP